MTWLEDKGFRWFLFVMLSVYLLCGFVGNLWLSDEFDFERTMIVSYFGFPIVMAFYGLALMSPDWWRRYPRLLWGMVVWLLLCFGWGNILLLNALGSGQWEVVDIQAGSEALDIAYKRGGFGWLYRQRW